MDISYELYKVFYNVALTLSFSEASRRLYISQSAVSQSIRTLEKKLGHPLFLRSTKKVQLTPEGETLFAHIEPAVHLIQKGEAELSQSSPLSGSLRIGASDTICRHCLVPYLQRFHQEYPHIRIKVVNQTSIGCAELLESGQADLIFSNLPNQHLDPKDTLYIIREFRDVFTASPAAFPLQHQTLSLEELLGYPILMLNRKSTTSEFLHAAYRGLNLTLTPEVELTSNDLLVDLAKIGLGIAFVPDFMVTEGSELYVLKTREQLEKRKVVLVHKNTPSPSAAAQEFIRYFTQTS